MERLDPKVRDKLSCKKNYKQQHHEFVSNLIDELDWLSYLIQMTKEMYEKQPAFDGDIYRLICDEEDKIVKVLENLNKEWELTKENKEDQNGKY